MATGHPIQVVAQRTGLSTDVIRIWERRYGAVTPGREGARRMYSEADIERLRLLRRAVNSGFRISDVAQLPDAQIAAYIQSSGSSTVNNPAAVFLDSCLQAIRQMDQLALYQQLLEAEAALTIPQLLDNLLAGLLDKIGALWESGQIRVAHEHMASTAIHAFLSSILATSNMTDSGPPLVAATTVGQNHGIGLLMAAITAASDGWKVLQLGTNIPAAEIAAAARLANSSAIALSFTYPADDPRIKDELYKLHELLPSPVVIYAGGKAVGAYAAALDKIGARTPASLSNFKEELRQQREPK